jgi:hypothetical protein
MTSHILSIIYRRHFNMVITLWIKRMQSNEIPMDVDRFMHYGGLYGSLANQGGEAKSLRTTGKVINVYKFAHNSFVFFCQSCFQN